MKEKKEITAEQMRSNKYVFLLSLPIFVEQLLQLLVGNIDQIMISHYSHTSVAAIVNGNQVMTIIIIVLNMMSMAAAVVIPPQLSIGKKEQVDISYTFSLVEKEMDQEAAVTANRIYTYASTNTLDGYLSEKEYIDYFCTDRNIFFWDLRDLFSTEELNELSNYIIYYTNSSGESFPIAVDISEAPVIKGSDLNMKQPCYGIISTSKYSENAANFIRFVFNMEKP